MYLDKLKPADGSVKNRKRIGRGNASGTGGTSGRGNKGAGSRSGSKARVYYEGGQLPIYRHLPKRGFKNIFKEKFQIVNLEQIARLQVAEVNPEVLHKYGLIKTVNEPVKILGRGEITSAVTVHAQAFSATAKEKLIASGGKAELL
ncbi:MAG: 50S ribosomal protein L15 [Candidatus Neomarinimicrobiota bacterium]